VQYLIFLKIAIWVISLVGVSVRSSLQCFDTVATIYPHFAYRHVWIIRRLCFKKRQQQHQQSLETTTVCLFETVSRTRWSAKMESRFHGRLTIAGRSAGTALKCCPCTHGGGLPSVGRRLKHAKT